MHCYLLKIALCIDVLLSAEDKNGCICFTDDVRKSSAVGHVQCVSQLSAPNYHLRQNQAGSISDGISVWQIVVLEVGALQGQRAGVQVSVYRLTFTSCHRLSLPVVVGFIVACRLGLEYDSMVFVTIHHETSVKSPLGHFQFMLYLESTCPKL